MADIRTTFIDMEHGADYAIAQIGLAEDDGLDTAVILSLFTDRRAEADDAIPDGSSERRGWWADSLADVENDQIGSRLWLLSREKQLPSVLVKAKGYIEEALAWLVSDGVAKAVNVETFIPRAGILGAQIEIVKPDGQTARYRFENFWSAN